MNEENGKAEKNKPESMSKNYITPFKEININTIKRKLKKNELTIEDVLMCTDCINDLITNRTSKYKSILTITNIIKLISFCLEPNIYNGNNSGEFLRYPYYSCELLCSHNILNFKLSIKNIKESNIIEEMNKQKGDKRETEADDDFDQSLIEDKKNEKNDESLNENKNEKELEKQNYFDLLNKDDINEETLMDFQMREESLTEIQKEDLENDQVFQYEKEEKDLINIILEPIFKFLNLNLSTNEATFLGYFQKIVNFLLTKESKITIDYLFDNKNSIFKKFYNHMNNASIQNIMENILNYLYDFEDNNDENSLFNMIIIILIYFMKIKIKLNLYAN